MPQEGVRPDGVRVSANGVPLDDFDERLLWVLGQRPDQLFILPRPAGGSPARPSSAPSPAA